jgi:uncharacterized protein YdeI (YjbR/CyaY-like superfamily)
MLSPTQRNLRRVDMDPVFFATPAKFRAWFQKHHDKEAELWVGFYKRESGIPSITWPEAVDQALCFGWIDGVRKSLDERRYVIRFTPRKPRSIWSAVNIKRVAELETLGLMHPAGQAAFGKRSDDRSATYAYEQRKHATLDAASSRAFQANKPAWKFFENQPPWYQRTATYWVTSAKKEETRAKRLATLIADSAAGKRIKQLSIGQRETNAPNRSAGDRSRDS